MRCRRGSGSARSRGFWPRRHLRCSTPVLRTQGAAPPPSSTLDQHCTLASMRLPAEGVAGGAAESQFPLFAPTEPLPMGAPIMSSSSDSSSSSSSSDSGSGSGTGTGIWMGRSGQCFFLMHGRRLPLPHAPPSGAEIVPNTRTSLSPSSWAPAWAPAWGAVPCPSSALRQPALRAAPSPWQLHLAWPFLLRLERLLKRTRVQNPSSKKKTQKCGGGASPAWFAE
jgi:hypothetical protein